MNVKITYTTKLQTHSRGKESSTESFCCTTLADFETFLQTLLCGKTNTQFVIEF